MVGTKDKAVYVRGRWVSFSREKINQTSNLKERKDGSIFKRLVEEPNFLKIVDVLTDAKGSGMPPGKTRMNPSPGGH